jgi:hypothetical protein
LFLAGRKPGLLFEREAYALVGADKALIAKAKKVKSAKIGAL